MQIKFEQPLIFVNKEWLILNMVYKGATSRVRGKVIITKVVIQEFRTRQDIIEVNADRFDVTKRLNHRGSKMLRNTN